MYLYARIFIPSSGYDEYDSTLNVDHSLTLDWVRPIFLTLYSNVTVDCWMAVTVTTDVGGGNCIGSL